nr:hypothetical protein [Tanacetum cinerariifolium]
MPPQRVKNKSVKRLVEKDVAKAIEEYEKTRANLDNVESFGGNTGNAGGIMNGVVGLRCWIEKIEQVFEICKCAEDDKVMFAASTFEGRALTWWSENVQTLGLVNANRILWTEFKSTMTTEYCPTTEIQRMEQDLWTLTLKGDDIKAYNNRSYKLALMCPDLVPNEKKKIERYIRGFPERIKGNITSSRPTTLHEAINMARELVEQAVYVNDHYACILFDSGAEKSFISTEFTPFIDIAPATLDTSYDVELADGKVVSTNTILRGCTLAIFNHVFKMNLLPTQLGEMLEKDPKLLSCIKAEEKKPKDIHIICDFLKVFPDDLSGLPPVREIEFCIDLIPGALLVVKSSYRLAPSEMLELSNQLKELQENGFIRPSHSP